MSLFSLIISLFKIHLLANNIYIYIYMCVFNDLTENISK